jgi:hypothetical protein
MFNEFEEVLKSSSNIKTIRETRESVVIQMLPYIDEAYKSGRRILEPSAGKGDLVSLLCRMSSKKIVLDDFKCVESNAEKVAILKSKGLKVVSRSYLDYDSGFQFDLVVACPPFKNGTDTLHIQKMYRDTIKGGRIVTLTSPKWIFDNTQQSYDFRMFLSGKNYQLKMLHDHSFVEKGKSVPTAILIIDK